MKSQSVLLKCVRSKMWEEPYQVLRLTDLQQLVARSPELRWSADPVGVMTGRNSDGTIVSAPPREGFTFTSSDQKITHFFLCYEFYDGIVIHAEPETRLFEVAMILARELRAKLFPM